jgi:hypothetical protein
MSPVSFSEFSKNPISAIAFIMLGVVGFLYYDSENTKKELIINCKKENEILSSKVEGMQRQIKKNDSLLAVLTFENTIYYTQIEAINEASKKNKK